LPERGGRGGGVGGVGGVSGCGGGGCGGGGWGGGVGGGGGKGHPPHPPPPPHPRISVQGAGKFFRGGFWGLKPEKNRKTAFSAVFFFGTGTPRQHSVARRRLWLHGGPRDRSSAHFFPRKIGLFRNKKGRIGRVGGGVGWGKGQKTAPLAGRGISGTCPLLINV